MESFMGSTHVAREQGLCSHGRACSGPKSGVQNIRGTITTLKKRNRKNSTLYVGYLCEDRESYKISPSLEFFDYVFFGFELFREKSARNFIKATVHIPHNLSLLALAFLKQLAGAAPRRRGEQ
jgi:hypothetical protein